MATMDHWFWTLIFFILLQTVASFVRYYVRAVILRKFGGDDIAHAITLILASAYCGCMLAIFAVTAGEDPRNMSLSTALTAVRLSFCVILLYIVGTVALKITLGLLLLRILISKWQKRIVYVCIFVSIFYGLVFFFQNLFQCGNPGQYPMRIVGRGSCFPKRTTDLLNYMNSVLSALLDLTYATLPVFYLRSAKMDMRTKVSVGFILMLGSAGCICTLVRIAWIPTLTERTSNMFTQNEGIGVMSAGELSIGITCMSVSTYKPLFKRFFPAIRRSLRGSPQHSNNSNPHQPHNHNHNFPHHHNPDTSTLDIACKGGHLSSSSQAPTICVDFGGAGMGIGAGGKDVLDAEMEMASHFGSGKESVSASTTPGGSGDWGRKWMERDTGVWEICEVPRRLVLREREREREGEETSLSSLTE